MSKDRISFGFSIVVLALFLFGCSKEDVKILPPFDKNITAEESAVLVIPQNSKVNRIDGKKRGAFRTWTANSKPATVLVPAGEHTIIFEYSHPQDGWAAKKLSFTLQMDAEKMYMLSVALDEEKDGGVVYSAFNVAASFVRDSIFNLIPFMEMLPRANPEGVVYHINEINQDEFDQYLLDSETKLPMNIRVLGILFGFLWVLVITWLLRTLFYTLFAGKFKNANIVIATIFSIGLVVAGILLINYNSSGAFLTYLLATLLLGIGISFQDTGSAANKRGLAALKGESVDSTGDASADIGNMIADFSARKFTNKYVKAIFHFNQAIAASPYNADFVTNRGTAYFQVQEWDKAIADFTRAVQLKPKSKLFKRNLADAQATAPNNSGLAKLNNKDFNGAIQDFTTAINFSPNNEIYIYNRGFAYYNLQDWTQAIADFSVAITLGWTNLSSNTATILNYRGIAYCQLQDWGKAITDFTDALRFDSDNETYKQNLEYAQTQAATSRM